MNKAKTLTRGVYGAPTGKANMSGNTKHSDLNPSTTAGQDRFKKKCLR